MEMDGIEATRLISEKSPDPDEGPRVLVLTTFEQDEYVSQALRAGASGFLLKRTPADELIAGIKVIAQGGIVTFAFRDTTVDKRIRQDHEFACWARGHRQAGCAYRTRNGSADARYERALELGNC